MAWYGFKASSRSVISFTTLGQMSVWKKVSGTSSPKYANLHFIQFSLSLLIYFPRFCPILCDLLNTLKKRRVYKRQMKKITQNCRTDTSCSRRFSHLWRTVSQDQLRWLPSRAANITISRQRKMSLAPVCYYCNTTVQCQTDVTANRTSRCNPAERRH